MTYCLAQKQKFILLFRNQKVIQKSSVQLKSPDKAMWGYLTAFDFINQFINKVISVIT